MKRSIGSANHVGDLLCRVVDDYRKLICEQSIRPPHDEIAGIASDRGIVHADAPGLGFPRVLHTVTASTGIHVAGDLAPRTSAGISESRSEQLL